MNICGGTEGCLKVEKTLYRVHRYFFERDSSIFASMFTLPSAAGERPEGELVENPIVLEGITSTDFDRFLCILYPRCISRCRLHEHPGPDMHP
jgi:hypothetical protein